MKKGKNLIENIAFDANHCKNFDDLLYPLTFLAEVAEVSSKIRQVQADPLDLRHQTPSPVSYIECIHICTFQSEREKNKYDRSDWLTCRCKAYGIIPRTRG